MATTILSPSTAAGTATLTLAAGETAYVTVCGNTSSAQLAAGEIITIDYYNGAIYVPIENSTISGLIGIGSNVAQFDSNNNSRTIGGGDSVTVRFNKPITSVALGLYRG